MIEPLEIGLILKEKGGKYQKQRNKEEGQEIPILFTEITAQPKKGRRKGIKEKIERDRLKIF